MITRPLTSLFCIPVLPAHPRTRTGERAGAPQPMRGGRRARQARRRRGVPDPSRGPRAARALHTAPPGGGPSPARPAHGLADCARARARRGARALELHPATAARPPRGRRVIANARDVNRF